MTNRAPPVEPARFWRRYAAWSLDAAIILTLALGPCLPLLQTAADELGHAHQQLSQTLTARLLDDATIGLDPATLLRRLLADPTLRAAVLRLQTAATVLLLAPLAGYALLATCWHALFEASRWQAAPGKRALGLRVISADGQRLPMRHAWARQLASLACWGSLNLGHAMAAWPPRHLALHDLLSHTRVTLATDAGRRLPTWAKAWIAAQAIAWLLACYWLTARALGR